MAAEGKGAQGSPDRRVCAEGTLLEFSQAARKLAVTLRGSPLGSCTPLVLKRQPVWGIGPTKLMLLTMACSILLSRATTLAPEALQDKKGKVVCQPLGFTLRTRQGRGPRSSFSLAL